MRKRGSFDVSLYAYVLSVSCFSAIVPDRERQPQDPHEYGYSQDHVEGILVSSGHSNRYEKYSEA
jgi:hypothetical protein